VTGDAVALELDLRRRLLVTGRAAKFRVRAGEREARLLAVIEFPHAPAVWGVALFAFLAEAALVNIRIFMASVASRSLYPERSSRMTLFARNGNVQPEKRKFRQIVIEVDHLLPALGQMTFLARRT
jgi:hypothetical protein